MTTHPLKASQAEPTNFALVSKMNIAFNNPKGNPSDISWPRVRAQVTNVGDEWLEGMKALGLDADLLEELKAVRNKITADKFTGPVDLKQTRDSLVDVNVFSYGGHHLMGIDADRDMTSVIDGVMTRFVKDYADLQATLAKHRSAGVLEMVTEGEFPTMIVKSAGDYPDAPPGKFLKSASYREPTFYDVRSAAAGE